MENKIIEKFIKFIEKDVSPTLKKDFKWFSKIIAEDLQKLTKKKKIYKQKDE